MNGKQYDLLDAVSMVSFIIGILNYAENIDQSAVDNLVKSAVEEIHEHLESQDRKINAIVALLGITED
nr:MAG TPA: hypothetical protein [Caudoviricetes sp.]